MKPNRNRQNKIPNWQDKVKKELKLLIVAGEKLRVPGILAIVFFSIGIALSSPFFPGVLGMVMYELIKDMCSNLIWKMFESPAKLSEYYRSGAMNADLTEELKNSDYRKKTAHFFEKTEILTIALKELISHQDQVLLQDFLQEIKSYPGILTTQSRESLLRTVKNSSWGLNLQVTQKEYIHELREVSVTKGLPPAAHVTGIVTWKIWVFSWVLSVLIGALIIVFLFCYFFGVCKGFGHSSILPLATSTIMLFPTGTFTPVFTTIPNTPSFTPFITNSPTPVIPTVTETPVLEVLGTFPLSTDTTGDEENGTKHSLKQGDPVSPIEWYGEDCQARVWWNGILVKIDWNTMAGKECP